MRTHLANRHLVSDAKGTGEGSFTGDKSNISISTCDCIHCACTREHTHSVGSSSGQRIEPISAHPSQHTHPTSSQQSHFQGGALPYLVVDRPVPGLRRELIVLGLEAIVPLQEDGGEASEDRELQGRKNHEAQASLSAFPGTVPAPQAARCSLSQRLTTASAPLYKQASPPTRHLCCREGGTRDLFLWAQTPTWQGKDNELPPRTSLI